MTDPVRPVAPRVNMYGVVDCPKCQSQYRWPTQQRTIQCDDCGFVEPLAAAPVPCAASPADRDRLARLREIRRDMREGRIVSWDDTMWMVETLEAL